MARHADRPRWCIAVALHHLNVLYDPRAVFPYIKKVLPQSLRCDFVAADGFAVMVKEDFGLLAHVRVGGVDQRVDASSLHRSNDLINGVALVQVEYQAMKF